MQLIALNPCLASPRALGQKSVTVTAGPRRGCRSKLLLSLWQVFVGCSPSLSATVDRHPPALPRSQRSEGSGARRGSSSWSGESAARSFALSDRAGRRREAPGLFHRRGTSADGGRPRLRVRRACGAKNGTSQDSMQDSMPGALLGREAFSTGIGGALPPFPTTP